MQDSQAQKIREGLFDRKKLCYFFLYCWFVQFGCVCDFVVIVLCRNAEVVFGVCCKYIRMTCTA